MQRLTLICRPDVVYVRGSLFNPSGRQVLIREDVHPGESFRGHSFEQLQRTGNGPHDFAVPEFRRQAR
jgi:hypothetical protein